MTSPCSKQAFELWKLPEKNENSYATGLHVRNSLKPDQLVEFIPIRGKQVRFYNCGPTVYDSSHLGHARTYIFADVIRRIMKNYFNYDVFYCMNITDVDDKIILKSNELKEDFTSFARRWEIDYWQDMDALGIDKPDVIVRVSEHIPEIIEYIENIIKNGFAYESNGSVYFSVEHFHNSENHCYAKLEPQSVNDQSKLEDGEGKLANKDDREKKSMKDFALWKASKPEEPKWNSPWGEGRPGWHIECSAMASAIHGYPLDIHMGGHDLKFPHHDNEMAQSEAYYNKCDHQNQWVNYFIHTGHLHIEGLKMAKSLKNFITIKHLLLHYNPRLLRLMFLKQNYDATMDYTLEQIKEAQVKDQRLVEFFRTINAVLLQQEINTSQKWTKREYELRDLLEAKQAKIHAHFKKNFNVPDVLKEIDDLVTAVNVYLKTRPYIHLIITAVFNYIKHVFNCVGLSYEQSVPQLKADDPLVKLLNIASSLRDFVRGNLKNLEAVAEQVLRSQASLTETALLATSGQPAQLLVVVRQFVESIAESVEKKNLAGLTKASDELRDTDLIEFGIKIDDGRPGESSLWKFEDKEVLVKEKEEKAKKEMQKEDEKRKKEEDKLKAMSVNPADLFKGEPAYKTYAFDENGIPSHDEKGQPLKEKAILSFKKKWDAQKKLYDQYLEITKAK